MTKDTGMGHLAQLAQNPSAKDISMAFRFCVSALQDPAFLALMGYNRIIDGKSQCIFCFTLSVGDFAVLRKLARYLKCSSITCSLCNIRYSKNTHKLVP